MHALLDCACTLACLFPSVFPSPFLASLYVSVFRDAINYEHVVLTRVIVYWAAAMSLVRVGCFFFPIPECFCLAALMYWLEGLVAEYEGFSTGTIPRKTARTVSVLSFGFSVLLLVFLCIVPRVLLPFAI